MSLWRLLVTLLLGYPVPAEMVNPEFPIFLQRAGGLLLTLCLTAISLAIGAGIGTVLALCRREAADDPRKPARARLMAWGMHSVASIVVECVRGLPIMLLVLLTFHLPYRLAGLRLPGAFLAITAFSLYAGAYFSEIMRAGFRSIPPGLRQAGLVLGLKPRKILLKIELPLVCRNMLPDVISLAVTVFKDTSTLAVVAVSELTYTGRQMLMSQPMNYGLVLFLTLLLYWAPASLLSALLVPRCDGGSDWRRSLSQLMQKFRIGASESTRDVGCKIS